MFRILRKGTEVHINLRIMKLNICGLKSQQTQLKWHLSCGRDPVDLRYNFPQGEALSRPFNIPSRPKGNFNDTKILRI